MSDRGHAAVEFALGAGLMLLPVALAVLAFGPWSEKRVMTEAAAAEAARSAVIALDLERGRDLVAEIAVNHGVPESEVRLGWCDAEPAPLDAALAGCTFARGTQVRAVVSVWTPLIATPWGPVGGVWVTGEHVEPIDLYRSLG